MSELTLQPRLRLLADLVPPGARLADVGTDHGYLPVFLLQRGQIRQAIASDVAPEPLAHARRTAAEYGVEGIEFRLCSGLEGIAPHETDVIVIAGMGGETILSILQAAPWTKDGPLLLLQPMTRTETLRSWLADNGYTFVSERLVRDKGELYPVLLVTGGQRPALTECEAYAGVALADDVLYGAYLDHQICRVEKAVAGLARAAAGERERLERYRALCEALRERRRML